MKRRGRIVVGVVTAVLAVGAAGFFGLGPWLVERGTNVVASHGSYEISAEARALHDTLLIADLHADSLLWDRDLLQRAGYGHVDFPRLREGNVALQVFPAVTKTPRGQNYERNTAEASDNITLLAFMQLWPPPTWGSLTARALHQANRLHLLAERAPNQVAVIRTTQDLERVLARREAGEQVVGAILGIEGCHALDGKLDNVQVLHEAGFRVLGLHHFFDNALGGSLHGEAKGGLTEFGREVVLWLEARNMIIDVAHSSPAVVDEVLGMATRPVILSHTGMQGVCQSARNLEDEQMVRIAEAGGLIGIGFWDGAVCDVTPAGIVKTIRYAIDLVGVDHVALGSDYDGATTTRFDVSELAVLTNRMLDAGFSEREIRRVMGENVRDFLLAQLPDAAAGT